MTRFLQGAELWKTLKDLAKKSSGRRLVAAPYVGQGAAKLLRLGKGDALLCALTLGNAKAGNVAPSELKKLQRSGVQLFMQNDLHAKIYLFGSKAVVCSANLSERSEGGLDEAGILLSDRDEVAAIRKWFEDRLAAPIQPKWLAKCAKAYRPPRGQGNRRRTQGPKRAFAEIFGPWIVTTHKAKAPVSEKPLIQNVKREARRRLKSLSKSDVEVIRMRWANSQIAREAKVGDALIQVCSDDFTEQVYPHGSILSIRHAKGAGGRQVAYFTVEMPKTFSVVLREEVDATLRKSGQSFAWKMGRVVDRNLAQALLRVTSPDRLRR